MKGKALIVIWMILITAFAGCSATGGDWNEPVLLDGTRWELTTLNGVAPLSDTSITAAFTEDEVTGSSGCNDYVGSYTLDGKTIAFEMTETTERTCLGPEGVMEQEERFLHILSRASRLDMDGDQLTLITTGGCALVLTTQSDAASPSSASDE